MTIRVRAILLACTLLLMAGCAGLRKVKRAFTPYQPSPACIKRFACEQYGYCGPNAALVIEGDTFCYYEDVTKGSRSERVCSDVLPDCRGNR